MGSINNMIQWFKDREGKVNYSQDGRLGPNSYDCSSAVYFALIAGGFIPVGSMGWTGSLHDTTLPPIAKKFHERNVAEVTFSYQSIGQMMGIRESF